MKVSLAFEKIVGRAGVDVRGEGTAGNLITEKERTDDCYGAGFKNARNLRTLDGGIVRSRDKHPVYKKYVGAGIGDSPNRVAIAVVVKPQDAGQISSADRCLVGSHGTGLGGRVERGGATERTGVRF